MNSARALQQISFYLLGMFRLECNSQTVHLATHKVESLFAYLALFPEQHPREQLAALLWGDATDEQARHSLRTALAAIRKELGDEILLADRETVRLNPNFPIWVDVREFPSALDLYRGELLPDFYDEWILSEREHLRAVYLDALLRLAQYHRAKSEYAHAIELAQKVLATDPTNEKAYQHIIFCLAATGDRIGALKQFDECAKKLRDDLGVEPSPDTIALRDQIEQALTGVPSREAALTNLPNPLTSFVGREKEQRELKELFEKTRLLTLTGVGGCGKTRLANQIARGFLPNFKYGVWWGELAALSDPALVPQTVARILGVQESSERSLTEMLTLFIRDKPMLIVLDNCEHLIPACAELAEKLLLACSNLKIITTSREPLNITGETVWRVPSLALPDLAHLPLVNELSCYDAIQLFIQRASAVEPGWKLNGNAAAVAHICKWLDGIPLAIELAAARLNVLSAEQVDARLADRFNLLKGGSRTELPRHQTLRAAIDWSYDLLSDAERATFRQLSVFAGGWTLEAAEAVVAQDSILSYNILDSLTELINKSLVVVEQKDNTTRYRLLETIRQYARDRLLELGEADSLRNRHLDFYLAFAKQAEPELRGAQQFQWLDRLDLEHDNIRTALEWSLSNESADKGLELVWSLLPFWDLRGYWSEGKDWASKLLAHVSANNFARTQGLLVASILSSNIGDLRTSRQYLEELVVIARELGEAGKLPLALGLSYLGNIVFDDNAQLGESLQEEGLAIARAVDVQWVIARLLQHQASLSSGKRDWSTARRAFEDSLAIYQAMGDKRNTAFVMGSIGRVIFRQHDNATGRRYIEASLLIAREIRDRPNIARSLVNLGEVNRAEGNYDLAKRYATEALEMARELGSIRGTMNCLYNLAAMALYEGEYERAKSLYDEGLALARKINLKSAMAGSLKGLGGLLAVEKKARQATQVLAVFQKFIESGDMRYPSLADLADYQRHLALARSQLDDATFNAAWAEGQKMTLEQALEYALENVK